MSKDNLGLNIPIQDTDKKNKDSLLPQINTLLTELKIADAIESTNQIIKQLDSINVFNIEPEHRLEILELFQPNIRYIHENLKKRYINQLQPLSEQKLAYIELSIHLQNSILNGYKIIIENINFTNNNSLKKNILPNSIYRAFKHFNILLDIYYQTYTQQAENIWKEMHIIYKYADECKISDHKINLEQNEKETPIETITPYKQALFIAITSPYEWRQIEQTIIYNYGELWNQYITIREIKSDDVANKSGMFFIPLNEDLPPYSFNFNPNISTANGATLDVSKLINYLKKEANNLINDKPKEANLAVYSFEKLIKHLTEKTKRKQQRFYILGNVFITFGFPATHYYINKKRIFTQESIGANSNFNNIQELELGSSILEESTDNNQGFQIDKALYGCKLTNIHAEGAGIIFQENQFPPIQPIEIIAMAVVIDNKSDLDETHWNIGTIRWIKHDREKKLMAGIEIFAPFAIAAAVQIIKNGVAVGYFQRAFLFYNDNENKFNLITPTVKFEVDKIVKIYSFYHNKFVETKLHKELITNNNFKCFSIDVNLPKILDKNQK